MKITLASKYGFCQGVINAINIVNQTLTNFSDENIYMLNKIVHNNTVCHKLKDKGLIILDDDRSNEDKINSIEKGIIIFSAHGHDEKLEEIASKRNLKIIDATCPKVRYNHQSIKKITNENKIVVYIGINNHPETIAALSLNKNIIFIDFKDPDYNLIPFDKEIYIHNQTTLLKKDLEIINNKILSINKYAHFVNDICFATTERQESLKEITDEDLIIIIGDKISSNSTRLYELAKKIYPDKDIFQVSSVHDFKDINLKNYNHAFITAGASTPDESIKPIIDYLKQL